MRRYAVFVNIITLLAGVFGYLLRRQELLTAFEGSTGLAIHGADATLMLFILVITVIIFFVAFSVCISVWYKAHIEFEDAFGTHSLLYPFMYTIIGVFWICGTIVNIMHLRSSGTLQTIDVYFSILSLLAANSVIFLSVEVYQGSRNKSPYALSIVPLVFLCFWLILIYRDNAANPVLLSYLYKCLAVIASIMSFYYTAGFVYRKPSPGKAVFCYSASVFFCFVTLADRHNMGEIMIIISVITVNTVSLFMLLRHLERKPAKIIDS